MNREISSLVEAFRGELEGCHGFLDTTGCPRSIGGRVLTLKDRIQTLALADQQYEGVVGGVLGELRALKWLADEYDEFGYVMQPDAPLPELAARLHGILAQLQTSQKKPRRRHSAR